MKTKKRVPRRPQVAPRFLIAGVGGSAGGLEAFTRLLQKLPSDAGIALVIVQHLDPSRESDLPRLLGAATTMPTHEITNNMRVEPNHVYVIPPNVSVAIAKGVLKLSPRAAGHVPHHSIDVFF